MYVYTITYNLKKGIVGHILHSTMQEELEKGGSFTAIHLTGAEDTSQVTEYGLELCFNSSTH